jgi:hypothetical protein
LVREAFGVGKKGLLHGAGFQFLGRLKSIGVMGREA